MARKTKIEAQETREQILDAAERLFESQGVSKTSLQAIASEAGATRGAVYWHFKDKADVFNAMMERIEWPLDKETLCRQDPNWTAQDKQPLVSLRNVMLDCLQTIQGNEQVRRLLNICHYQTEYTADLSAVRERMLNAHHDFYERHLQAFAHPDVAPKLLPSISPETLAKTMQNIVLGLISTWLLNPQAFDLVAMGETSIDIVLRGAGLDPQWARSACAQA